MRGTPYIYQGEELGMTNPGFDCIEQYRDVESINYFRILRTQGLSEEEALAILQARSRDNSRTPMQWDASPKAGFTDGDPWIGVSQRRREANVAAENGTENSILHYYRRLIAMRKDWPVVSDGDIRFLLPDHPAVIAYERTLGQERLWVYCNFTQKEQTVSHSGGRRFVMGSYENAPAFPADGRLLLRPLEGCVLR